MTFSVPSVPLWLAAFRFVDNIPQNHWKVVTRKGSDVRTISAAEAGIGKSRHEAFIQLMNSPLYQDGITVR